MRQMTRKNRDEDLRIGGFLDNEDLLDNGAYIPALLTSLSNTLTADGSSFYRRNFGIGITDWRLLRTLASEPWISAQRVCMATGLDKGVVSRSVAWLEESGLILVRGDERDARVRLLALSREGSELHARMTRVARARERNFLEVLSAHEITQLVGLLGRLARNVDAFSKPVPIPPSRGRPPGEGDAAAGEQAAVEGRSADRGRVTRRKS